MIKRNSKGQFIKNKINITCLKDEDFKFWFYGLIAADGCLKQNSLSISQSGINGLNLIKYIKTKFKTNGKISNYKNSHSLYLRNKKLLEDIRIYGITERKTYILDYSNNIKDFKSFLRGYFEGDGCVGVYNIGGSKSYLKTSFVSTKKFSKKVLKLIPVKGRLYKVKRAKNLYEICFNGNKAVEFLNWLYKNENLYKTYKYNIYKNFLKNRFDNTIKYNNLRQKASKLLKKGHKPKEVATKLNLPFQTIYYWRSNGKI